MTFDELICQTPGAGIINYGAVRRSVLLEEAMEFTAEQWARVPPELARVAYDGFSNWWLMLVRNKAPQKWRDEVLAAKARAAIAAWPDAAAFPPY